MSTKEYLLDYLGMKLQHSPFDGIDDARQFLVWLQSCETVSPWDKNKAAWAKNIVALHDHITEHFPEQRTE